MSTGRREREEQGRGGSRKNGIGSSRVARLRWCVVCRGPRRRMRMEGTLDVALWQGTQEGNRQRQDLAAYLAAASDSGQTPPPPTLPLHLRWSRAKHTLESWQQGKLSKVSPALSRAKPYSSDSRDIARYRADALTTAADHAVEEERQQAVAAAHLRFLASRMAMVAAAELAAAELAAAINCCTYYHQRKGRTRDKEVRRGRSDGKPSRRERETPWDHPGHERRRKRDVCIP